MNGMLLFGLRLVALLRIACHGALDGSVPSAVVKLGPEVARASGLAVGLGIEDVNHELYGGLSSQLIFGEDFEEPAGNDGVSGIEQKKGVRTWRASSNASFEVVASNPFNGKFAQLLQPLGETPATITNRGLGDAGLYFVAGRSYDGYLFARAVGAASTLQVALVAEEGTQEQQILASETFTISSNQWSIVKFNLTAKAGAACTIGRGGSTGCSLPASQPERECVRCSGAVQLSAIGAPLVVDYVFLQPGSWGRYEGLPVRRDVALQLRALGLSTLRLGGSMCNVDGYRWKNFRGPRSHRAPYIGTWYTPMSAGWRIFEFLDLCEALGVQAVVTLNNEEAAADIEDLMEYAYGNSKTRWGTQRIMDGRSTPYPPFTVEIGNEQPLSNVFVRQVADLSSAMYNKVKELQASHLAMITVEDLHIGIGHNLDMAGINTPEADAMVEATRFLGSNVFWDLHVWAEDASKVDEWVDTFKLASGMLERLHSKMKLGVLEENADNHDVRRAMARVRYSNAYARLGDLFTYGTVANGLQVFGQNDNGWDQGVIFMTPSEVWLSPFGLGQRIMSTSFQPRVLKTEVHASGPTCKIDAQALRSEDNGRTVVRAVNWGDVTCDIVVEVPDCVRSVNTEALESATGNASDVNPPSEPHFISIRSATLTVGPPPGAVRVTMHSSSILVLSWKADKLCDDKMTLLV
eukprot:TRINITY_DN8261_c1_g4_i1.p1 TRINITY_DN8261_c1_g4~~TRINITY_DN8261_c1_g4_i1.p1  ORF type:complete len:709 (+),score=93.64 TRINITY_DN8261_c1_g4_i1:54-2129(+)